MKVWGNMDYGKKDFSFGWCYIDVWFLMVGGGDKGELNGLLVDEWGICVDENLWFVGFCVVCGGVINDVVVVYVVIKVIDWLKNYILLEVMGMIFGEVGFVLVCGDIVQQMFWYMIFIVDMVKFGMLVMNEDGMLKWCMVFSLYGVYWIEGIKVGYQDVGLWMLLKFILVDCVQVVWFYVQFVILKMVDVKKLDVGLIFICQFIIDSQYFIDCVFKLGGLVEFYCLFVCM